MGVRIDSSGRYLNPFQPAFSVCLSANTGSVTGDGTQVTAPFDTKLLDQGNNFNTGTFTYTFPVSGFYQLSTTIFTATTGGVNTNGFIWMNLNAGAKVARLFEFNFQNLIQSTTELILSGSIGYNATAGDTASVTVIVQGVSKNVVLLGSGTISAGCLFSGYLIC